MGVGGQPYVSAAFTPRKDTVPILQEAGWAPGSVWTAENLVPTGIRSWTVHPVASRHIDWAILAGVNIPLEFPTAFLN